MIKSRKMMDKRKFYFDHNNRHHLHRSATCNTDSSITIVNSKSIKTQTEESYLFNRCSCHERFYYGNNINSDDVLQHSLSQNPFWKSPDCVPLCPMCNRTVLNSGGCSQNNQLCQYPMPWYPTYAQYNGCVPPLGVPPFLHVPMFHGLLPYNGNVTNSVHGLECLSSKTSTSKICNNSYRDSVTSVTENENLNNVSPNLLINNINISGKNKLKTSSIRSEPNVTKNGNQTSSFYSRKNVESKIKCEKNLLNSLLSKAAVKKNHYKSDTDIPVVMNSKLKKSYSDRDNIITSSSNNLNNNYCKKDFNYNNRFNKNTRGFDYVCDNRGDYNVSNYNEKELRSPIYKYADLRIHELSSNLKNIKDNIYKLSTKASELNVSDPGCDDDNLKNYFKNMYANLNDEVAKISVNDVTKPCSEKVPYNSFNNFNRNDEDMRMKVIRPFKRVNDNETQPFHNFPSQKTEINELFTNRYSLKKQYESSDSYGNQINVMKRTMPLRDIPSAFNKNDEILSQVPEKIKSDIMNERSEAKLKNVSNKITAHVIVPNRSSDFNKRFNNGDKKKGDNCSILSNYGRKKLNCLNRQYANISFNSSYESFINDEDSYSFETDKNTTSVDEKEVKKNVESVILNEKQRLSSFFHVDPEDFRNYTKLVCDINEDDEDGNDNTVEGEYEDEGECNTGGDGDFNENVEDNLSPIVRSQQNMVNIENWLEKTVETSEQDVSAYPNQNSANRRQSQLTALNNLEILSKISEEDEDKFSTVSESSDQHKCFLIRGKSFFNNDNKLNISKTHCLTDKSSFNEAAENEDDSVLSKRSYNEDNHESVWNHKSIVE